MYLTKRTYLRTYFTEQSSSW